MVKVDRPFSSLIAFYAISDVCMVTPLRDGMNLVAKEYIATRRDGSGVLILSEMAGSAKELPEAIIINPNNGVEIAAATLLSPNTKRDIMARYSNSRRRGFFLDYDGTLTPLARYPTLARPGDKILGLLRSLAANPENTVVITSGRDRDRLESWFGELPVGLIAEHGVWAKRSGQPWNAWRGFANPGDNRSITFGSSFDSIMSRK